MDFYSISNFILFFLIETEGRKLDLTHNHNGHRRRHRYFSISMFKWLIRCITSAACSTLYQSLRAHTQSITNLIGGPSVGQSVGLNATNSPGSNEYGNSTCWISNWTRNRKESNFRSSFLPPPPHFSLNVFTDCGTLEKCIPPRSIQFFSSIELNP